MKFLVFKYEGSLLSIPVDSVESIEKVRELVSIDSDNPYFRGFAMVRGRPIPVFSYKAMPDRYLIVMILETEGGRIGIAVDDVMDVMDGADMISKPSDSHEIFIGSIKMHEQDIPVIDTEAIIRKMEVLANEGAGS